MVYSTPDPDFIHMRVCKIVDHSNRDHDKVVGFFNTLTVPLVGELINCLGTPYIVVERSWGFDTDGITYAYLRVK